MVEATPQKQKALCKTAPGGEHDAIEIDVPVPASGQVLIKVECAPINPSDIYFITGLTEKGIEEGGGSIAYPFPTGWEGAGTVLSSGGGLMGWNLVGKRVAFSKGQEPREGSFTIGGAMQQYAVTSAMQCMSIPDDVSFEHGAMHFVNPMTAIGLIDSAQSDGAQAIIQTAAASQLGRMINRLCIQKKIPLINIVRREEQAVILREMGAEIILNSTVEGWTDELAALAKKFKATACFEAIGGDMTGHILNEMPRRSTVYFYGALAQQPVGAINPLLLIGRDQKITGWMLPMWMKNKSLWAKMGIVKQCQAFMQDSTFKSEIAKRISLDEVKEGIVEYQKNMTAGKYVIYPHGVPSKE